jgi:hypothetical protein
MFLFLKELNGPNSVIFELHRSLSTSSIEKMFRLRIETVVSSRKSNIVINKIFYYKFFFKWSILVL